MTQSEQEAIIAQSDTFLLPLYKRAKLALVGGEGAWLHAADGRRLLDGTAGIAVNALGYGDAEVVAAIQQAATGLLHTSNLYYTASVAELAQRLVDLTPWASKAFFCNSGTEAIEASLKFARRYTHNQRPEQQTGFVAFHDSFHGRSMGALSVTSREAYRTPFNPLIPSVRFISLECDQATLEATIDASVAAVIIEPIQGEGGIRPISPEFAQALRRRCDQVDAILIFDEIQCGMGRTGDVWAHEALGMAPDIMALAKPLGGGLPIGAVLVNERVAKALNYGDHGTTFGGNPFICAVANVVLQKLTQPTMLDHVRSVGAELGAGLRDLGERFDVISAVRGRGLIWGVEFKGPTAAQITDAAFDQGLLLVGSGNDVVRVIPPLVLGHNDAEELVTRLGDAISQVVS
ncbi:aspartate aminotransferase family protein [Herpetosiphon llansteffanensis]|uniref:aspartate aminotransferase family protein n=1 Tax=Herpetosiphon llansteffanensis TaxID=2094568 RepID=UPI000D7C1595|nr:aspartate aminotransferase family protein [Herpetosiphon llansteffanensis]